MPRNIVAMAGLLALVGCESMEPTAADASGAWGGQHVGLVVEGGLGSLEYDCASGTIDSFIAPAHDGTFTAKGTHRPGQGGPIRVGQIFRAYPATYSGRLVKDEMTLHVKLEDGTTLGPYTLRRGAVPQITRCL